MNKHRLELFSDGVFAIVLTLLVLDLHVPLAYGAAAFFEIVPALLVHAASFLVGASLWMAHHGVPAVDQAFRCRPAVLKGSCTLLPCAAAHRYGCMHL